MDHKKELMLIKELMDKLVDEMEPSVSDFEERLGRAKPEIKSVEIEGVIPGEEMEDSELEHEEEELGEDLDGDMEMGEDPEHAAMVLGEEATSPEEKLKQRIMKLRG